MRKPIHPSLPSLVRGPRSPELVSNPEPAFQEPSSRTACTFFIEADDIQPVRCDFLRWMYRRSPPLDFLPRSSRTNNRYLKPRSGFMISCSISIDSSIVPIPVIPVRSFLYMCEMSRSYRVSPFVNFTKLQSAIDKLDREWFLIADIKYRYDYALSKIAVNCWLVSNINRIARSCYIFTETWFNLPNN